jgi:methionyl-tRNA formyltransferase
MNERKTVPSRDIKCVFFGTPDIAVSALNELKEKGILPALVITAPDAPRGRGMQISPTPVKLWALEHDIDCIDEAKISEETIDELENTEWDVFIVVAYGKLLPQRLLDIPRCGCVNLHPSMLPLLRGPSPIQSAILNNAPEAVGVSVMLLDSQMDHGPIIAQGRVEPENWPTHAPLLYEILVQEGCELLAEVLPMWVAGSIEAAPQNDTEATYCKKILKTDAEIDLGADAHANLLKIRGYLGAPTAYTFVKTAQGLVRVKITDAHIDSDALVIDTCTPEGESEMPWAQFVTSAGI